MIIISVRPLNIKKNPGNRHLFLVRQNPAAPRHSHTDSNPQLAVIESPVADNSPYCIHPPDPHAAPAPGARTRLQTE